MPRTARFCPLPRSQRVGYSLHSSFSELKEFVGLIKPTKVYSTSRKVCFCERHTRCTDRVLRWSVCVLCCLRSFHRAICHSVTDGE